MKWPEELNFMKISRLPQQTTTTDMLGKTVVLSGATSGVGLAAMKRLLQANADIVMVVRNQAKADKIKADLEQDYDAKIDIVIADFSDNNSIQDAAKTILKTYTKIDVLINSVGMHSTKKRHNKDGREMVFQVNHLGPFLFTRLLLPLLQKSAPSRIIQVNSEGHRFNGLKTTDIDWKKRIYTGLRGYGASKTAQLLTVLEFNDRLQGSGVTINAMHPGAVKSKIGSNNGFLYRLWNKLFTQPFLKDPAISGNAIYFLAADPSLDNTSGLFFNLTNEEVPAKHARNREKSAEVWTISNTLTNLPQEL